DRIGETGLAQRIPDARHVDGLRPCGGRELRPAAELETGIDLPEDERQNAQQHDRARDPEPRLPPAHHVQVETRALHLVHHAGATSAMPTPRISVAFRLRETSATKGCA